MSTTAAWSTLAAALSAAPGRMDALVVIHHGEEVVAWGRRPGEVDRPHDLRSVTKSITALLVARALDAGALTWDTALGDALALPDPAATRTVRDLLTMRSGLDCDDRDRRSPGHEDRMYRRRDWLAHWAALSDVEPAGTTGRYCTGNFIALGVLLEAAVDRPVPDWAETTLFGPLGLTGATWARWEDHADTGGHLRLSARGLARVGRLVAGDGAWQGEALLQADTLARLLAPVTTVDGLPYAHGWWYAGATTADGRVLDLHLALGNGGQLLAVVPALELVVAATGRSWNRPADADGWLVRAISAAAEEVAAGTAPPVGAGASPPT